MPSEQGVSPPDIKAMIASTSKFRTSTRIGKKIA
jgi:hypothetical protein